MELRIMSFNTQHCLNFLTRKIDFDSVADAVRGVGAHIVGLNEMRGAGTDPEYTAQTEILAEKLGYYSFFAKAIDVKGSNPYGNGLLSKYPILSAEVIPIPDPVIRAYNGYYESRCVLKARIDVPGGIVTVLVSHFGLNPDEQKNAVETVIGAMDARSCIFMGDLNVTPEDSVLLPIRDKLFDTAELFGGKLLSFPSDEPDRKIDYIFTTRDVSVTEADIPEIVVSDHRPHLAVIHI